MRRVGTVLATPRALFMSWFFMGAYANFLVFNVAINVRYQKNKHFTKLKWIGSLIGFIVHSFMCLLVYIFHSLLDLAPWGAIILIAYYIALIIFNIIYKKVIEPRNNDFYDEHSTIIY